MLKRHFWNSKRYLILLWLALITTLVSLLPADNGQIDILPDGKTTFIVTKPGSYILVGNVKMTANVSCISIRTNDVALDLNGHTIEGTGIGTAAFGVEAVEPSGPVYYDSVRITNGTVKNFGKSGVSVGNNSSVLSITAYGNKGGGIDCSDLCVVENCKALKNGEFGIRTSDSGVIRNCICSENESGPDSNCSGIIAGEGSIVLNNVCSFNKSNGNYTAVGISASASLIQGNVCRYNQGLGGGIATGISTNHCIIKDNLCEYNISQKEWGIGINAGEKSVVENNICRANDSSSDSGLSIGIKLSDGSSAINNECNDHGSTIENRSGYGIWVLGSRCKVIGNKCTQQGASGTGKAVGIMVAENSNLIRDNHAVNNKGPAEGGYGILTDILTDCRNLVIGNTTSGNSAKGIKFSSTTTGGYAAANITSDGIDFNGANNKNGTSPAPNVTY